MAEDKKLTYWLLGFVATLLIGIGGFSLTSMNNQQSALSIRLNGFEAGATERTNKIVAVQTEQVYTAQRLSRIEENQIKANEKLDNILIMVTKHMAQQGGK